MTDAIEEVRKMFEGTHLGDQTPTEQKKSQNDSKFLFSTFY